MIPPSAKQLDSFILYRDDCLYTMAYLSDNDFDAVITDPPYNVGKDYDGYKDNLPDDEYESWMSEVIGECDRVSSGRVAFYVGGMLAATFFGLIPGAHMTVVHKRAIGPMYNNYFLQYHLLFSTMNPIVKTKDLWDDVRLPGEGYFFNEERYDHPAMTGLVLTKKIIETFVPPGGKVLDPFMGTGTTGVACAMTGRQFVGIEQSQKYYDIAVGRIKLAQKQLRLEI